MSEHHVVPVRTYVAIFFALMVFTAITVAVAYLDLGALNNVVMLGIAVAKATLVVLFFMHVRYSTRLIPLVVVGAVFFLLLMFGITMADYVSRGALGAGSAWPTSWEK
jgi:cytochrome c oxidase subunit 4